MVGKKNARQHFSRLHKNKMVAVRKFHAAFNLIAIFNESLESTIFTEHDVF
jgi:hypothetical protein